MLSGASLVDVKAAFRRHARKRKAAFPDVEVCGIGRLQLLNHPDKGGSLERSKELNAAKDFLFAVPLLQRDAVCVRAVD